MPAPTEKYLQANARTYTPGGEADPLENVSAIALRLHLHPKVVRDRLREGARQRKVKLVREPSYAGYVCQRSKVDELFRSPFPGADGHSAGWIDEFRYRDPKGRIWLTLKGALALHPGLPDTSLKRWASSPCRYLLDNSGKRRPIQTDKVKPPIGRAVGKVTIYLEADLKAIADAVQKPLPPAMQLGSSKRYVPAEVHTDDDGERWPTETQATRLGVSPNWLRANASKIQRKLLPNPRPGPGGPGEVTGWNERDILRALDPKHSANPGVGKGRIVMTIRRKMVDRAWQIAKTRAAENGGQVSRGAVFRAARADREVSLRGISERFVRQAVEEHADEMTEMRTVGPKGYVYTYCVIGKAAAALTRDATGQTPVPRAMKESTRGPKTSARTQIICHVCAEVQEAGVGLQKNRHLIAHTKLLKVGVANPGQVIKSGDYVRIYADRHKQNRCPICKEPNKFPTR